EVASHVGATIVGTNQIAATVAKRATIEAVVVAAASIVGEARAIVPSARTGDIAITLADVANKVLAEIAIATTVDHVPARVLEIVAIFAAARGFAAGPCPATLFIAPIVPVAFPVLVAAPVDVVRTCAAPLVAVPAAVQPEPIHATDGAIVDRAGIPEAPE